MKRLIWPSILLLLLLLPGCNDGDPFARAYKIKNRAQIIGGTSALADLDDYILENDKIRVAFPEKGNSVGPGVFGGSLIDADLRRTEAPFRGGRGKDQFTELFPIGNLSIPALCVREPGKHEDFCQRLPKIRPSIGMECRGDSPCRLDTSDWMNADYALEGAVPSEEAAIIRVQGQAGNYLEVLGLVSLVNVKTNFHFRNDYILEPGASHVRIRTLLSEIDRDGEVLRPEGEVIHLPPLKRAVELFGLLLGSGYFDTELPDMEPGVAGGDFLFFGERMKIYGAGIGFDIYKEIRNKFALGQDPLNEPIAADFLAGVGENVSYAIGNADASGRYLLPLYSGAVTAGFSHGAHCYSGDCQGTPEQCANVVDCSDVRSFVFERIFAVGDGDVASAARSIYETWGTPLGRIRGHVYDRRTGEPVSQAEVHVFKIPANMAECRPEGDPATPYTAGAAGFRQDCLEQRNYMGAVNHLRTDRRATDMPEGAFDGFLPAGRYYLMAKKLYRPASEVLEVGIRADRTTEVALHLLPPARVQYQIQDESGRHVPAKLTIGQCFPNCSGRLAEDCGQDADCASGKCLDGRCLIDNCPADRICDLEQLRCVRREPCHGQDDCEPTERCQAAPGASERRCVCANPFFRQAALGEGSYPKGLGRYLYSPDGFGEFEIEPGSYEVVASRGMEYSIDRKQVALAPNQTALVNARLVRQVDTSGWISGDFHVHGQNSYDAVVKHRDRVMAFAGEGVEVLSTSDHDYITDLAPYVFELGLERWVITQVGLELTTVELGHFLGFPYRYEEWRDGKRIQEQGAIDWTGKVPDKLFSEMRALGLYGPEDTVIVVAHPRDSFFGYFDQYGLNAYNMQAEGSTFEWLKDIFENPLANPELFSGKFDALELFNSKRYELIRTPTAGEIREYNHQREQIQAQGNLGMSPDAVERELIALDRRLIKDIIERTPIEQDAVWDSDGEESCDTIAFCTQDGDCDAGAGELCDRNSMSCYRPCATDADCDGTAQGRCLDGRCDPGFAPADSPCTSHEGVIDDWFRMLDYGVVRTGMGNSDTHQLFTQTEAGLPRNFIRLSAEEPKGVDRLELARNISAGKLMATYGPFVQVWLDDREVGETLSINPGAEFNLRVRVQSPTWFDVDRVEVYSNGRLIHVFTGSGDELDPQSGVDVSGLRLPNQRPVNLDAVILKTAPQEDAWYVAIAMGLEGRDLSPIYGEHPYLKLQIGDILSRSLSSVPLPFDVSGALIPRVFRIYPYGVTNPVFLDVDGNGEYDAPHSTPEWAEGGKDLSGTLRQSLSSPLMSARGASSPLADETDYDAWRLRQLRYFQRLIVQAVEPGFIK
jgi:hypothetical protein